MTAPRALILRAPGINCERETADAFARAGAAPELVHVRHLRRAPELLDDFAIFVAPGGFSYGDDIAAGRVLAHELQVSLGEHLLSFVDRGGLVLGICNGFQMLARLGLLPRVAGTGGEPPGLVQQVALAPNLSDRYECRWVTLRAPASRCAFLPADLEIRIPAAHGEGRVVPRDAELARRLHDDGHVAFVYVDAGGRPTAHYPENPNGSPGGIAGLTDVTGRVLGLMPHPDRAYLPHHAPRWRRDGLAAAPDGMAVFDGMVRAARGAPV